MLRRTLILLTILTATTVHAQSVVHYGPGTGMKVTGTPRLGQTVAFETTRALGGRGDLYNHIDESGMLVFGVDRTLFQFRAGFGRNNSPPPWAYMLTTPALTVVMAKTGGGSSTWTYATKFPIPIPNNASLIGAKVHGQWVYRVFHLISYPPSSAYRMDYLETSDAAIVTVGR